MGRYHSPGPKAALAVLLGSLAGFCLWTAAQLDRPDFTPAGLVQTLARSPAVLSTGTVYLTFDDGPSPHTQELLDVLEEEEVPATFFLTGFQQDGAGDLLRRMRDEGHALGVHCWNHNYGTLYSSQEGFWEDFDRMEAFLIAETGVRPTLCRLPGGSANQEIPAQLREAILSGLTDRGYTYVDWNVLSGDDTDQVFSPQELLENVTARQKDQTQLVILFHDTPLTSTTPEGVRLVIDHYRELGWSFGTLEEEGAPCPQFVLPS